MRLLAPGLSSDDNREIEAAIRAPNDKPVELKGLVTADLTATLAAKYPKGLVYDDTTDGLKFSNGSAFIGLGNLSGGNTWSGTQVFSGLVSVTGGQIAFPATQVASADANTLDDYEEGTWTPALTFGGGSTGITYATQIGKYTKVGNVVDFVIQIILTSKGSSTGSAQISLPFTSAAGVTQGIPVAFATGIVTSTTVGALISTSSAVIQLQNANVNFGATLNETNVSNTTLLYISGLYFT